jgi:hypothetical protein
MPEQHKIVYVNTASEESLEEGAREIGDLLAELGAYIARRRQRVCPVCSEREWMNPGEQICWKCGRCYEVLVMLSHPLTESSSPEHRALREVIDWMEDVSEGQERSPQEIQQHFDELRASYTWSAGKQYTKQDSYQDHVLNLLSLSLYDMNLFFRRLSVVREYYNQLTTDTEPGKHPLTLWNVAERA